MYKKSCIGGLELFYWHVSILSTQDLASRSVCVPQPGPRASGVSVLLCWFLEFAPTESLGSYCQPLTLPLRKISTLHADPGSPGPLSCQALSCPGLTSYILFCNHKCDLEIGVFAYLHVWMQCLVATSTWAYSNFRGLVLCFISQNLLPYRFSEKCVCVAGQYTNFCSFCFVLLMPLCDIAFLERQWCQIVRWAGWIQGISSNNPAREDTLFIHYSGLSCCVLNKTRDLNAKYPILNYFCSKPAHMYKNNLEIW